MNWFIQICLASVIFHNIISEKIEKLIFLRHCPKHMVNYISDENSTNLVCDCAETFLYSNESDSCHQPYKQGPCPDGHFFILPPNEEIAKCEKNPCHEDGLVPFQGGCHFLDKIGSPCEDDLFLRINEKTLELGCVNIPGRTRSGIINAPQKACRRGSRRIARGICKREL